MTANITPNPSPMIDPQAMACSQTTAFATTTVNSSTPAVVASLSLSATHPSPSHSHNQALRYLTAWRQLRPILLALTLGAGAYSNSSIAEEQPPSIPPKDGHPPIETASDSLPVYDELPLNLRQDVKRPKISIHYYHEDPEQRYVNINGFSAHEGLPIGRELWVHEIRKDGVVLKIEDRFFFVPNH